MKFKVNKDKFLKEKFIEEARQEVNVHTSYHVESYVQGYVDCALNREDVLSKCKDLLMEMYSNRRIVFIKNPYTDREENYQLSEMLKNWFVRSEELFLKMNGNEAGHGYKMTGFDEI
jgi:sugar diacid utilization regulator